MTATDRPIDWPSYDEGFRDGSQNTREGMDDRVLRLEAVLTAARNLIDVQGPEASYDAWDELERVVRAADAPPPTERTRDTETAADTEPKAEQP